MLARARKWFADKVGHENIEFLSHSRNYLSATAVQSLLTVAAIPILAGLLTPAEYGILSVYVSLYSLLSILFSLNLRAGIVRYYLEKSDDFDRALGANLLFVSAVGMILLAALLPISGTLSGWLALDDTVFRLALLTAVCSGILEIYLSYLRGAQQSVKYSIIVVLRTAGILGGAIVLIMLLDDKRYFGKIYAELFFVGAFAIYSMFVMVRMSRLSLDTKYVAYTCAFSVPLIPHAVSRYILAYSDRIIIQQLVGSLETGLYSLAYDVAMAMDVVVMATTKAWQPIFFELYREQKYDRISRMAHSYSGYIYFVGAAIILFGGDIVRLIIPDRYFGGLHLIPVLVLGNVLVFLFTLFFQYASYAKKTWLISASTFVAGAANIALNYWLIPIYGYEVAAYTTTASFALLSLIHYGNARFILKSKMLRMTPLMRDFSLLVALAAGYAYTVSLPIPGPLFLLARLLLLGVGFYYFIVKIAKGAKRD